MAYEAQPIKAQSRPNVNDYTWHRLHYKKHNLH